MKHKNYYLVLIFLFIIGFAKAQDNTLNISIPDTLASSLSLSNSKKVNVSYGGKGWELKYGNNNLMQVEWRLQTRYMHQSSNPSFIIPEEDSNDKSFNLQRFRLKVGGYAYKPFIKYYIEYDFPSNNLLNTVVTISKYDFLQLKLGQWKLNFNNERFISSGKQQLVDRSISNRFFTLDRQIGIQLLGNIFKGTFASSSYYIGIFNGNGINTQNNDGEFMLFMRYQLNLWDRKIRTSFCDIEYHEKPKGFIAFAYMNNESRFTSFSSSGGGQLPGYLEEANLFYNINQYNVESMFKYKGFSFSSETHLKKIHNDKTLENTELVGGYVMTGYFFNHLVSFIPKPLELTARYSLVNNRSLFTNSIKEYMLGANWFFSGHRNKLTIDFAYIENQDFIAIDDNYRVRLQWDFSF